MSRLFIISNRVGDPDAVNAGGLATAMLTALREQGGIWLGWSGAIATSETGAASEASATSETIASLETSINSANSATSKNTISLQRNQRNNVEYAKFDLTQQDHDNYYAGFSNRSLWPLFHYRPDLVDFQRDDYIGYMRVNELFAHYALQLLRADDLIWIHDYHLIPLASYLRSKGVRNQIGFFLHTPLAPPELLRTLPCHEELFGGFKAYDLIGVQTKNDLHALLNYCEQTLSAKLQPGGWVRLPSGRTFQCGAFPISIDANNIAQQARSAIALPAIDRLYDSLSGRALMVGVDRLDYSKGLPERFEAFGRLLEQHPNLRGRVTMLQIAPPSRESVPEYQAIRADLERTAGHINGLYAAPDWIPIRYVNRSFPQSLLAGYYRTAQVALVTPLRDGMNLVAKEYVASQNPENPGVLVLSRFAGAALELEAALQVNPFDQDEVAEAMARALNMSVSERRVRWKIMMEQLREHDINAWRKAFLEQLAERKLLTMQSPTSPISTTSPSTTPPATKSSNAASS